MQMRVDLGVGLIVRFDESSSLIEFPGMKLEPDVRRLGEILEVLFDEEVAKESNPSTPIYYMYRNVAGSLDETLRNMGLRHDVTVMPPRLIGREYAKTLGHYHPEAARGLSYPELYSVVRGEAHFLFQREREGKIEEVILIEAAEGAKVLIPPNYGHVTINPSARSLILSNLVCSSFQPIYEPYRKHGGAAYYELAGGIFEKNKNYGEPPEIRVMEHRDTPHIFPKKPLLTAFKENPEAFTFLRDPSKLKEPFFR